MHIHREGYKIIFSVLLLIAVLWFLLDSALPTVGIAHVLFYIGFGGLLIWTIGFFRVPHRKINNNDISEVISSADGRIVAVEEVFESEYFNDKRIQVSVFMSPLNVHVNWYPIDGEVSYTKYHPGKFMVAYHPKSSTENERNTIVVKNEKAQEILVRQIAGFMARRIISQAKVGDKATKGSEFGIIRFGSRLDFFFPPDTEICVKLGDKITAQQTVLGKLPQI